MKDFNDLEQWSPKELRKLRMNLNNRLESFKNSEKAKELASSHMLHGLERGECEELLQKVKQVEKKLAKSYHQDE